MLVAMMSNNTDGRVTSLLPVIRYYLLLQNSTADFSIGGSIFMTPARTNLSPKPGPELIHFVISLAENGACSKRLLVHNGVRVSEEVL